MSGGGTIQPENPRRGGIVNNMFSIVVDPARLAGVDWMRREGDGFLSYGKGSPPPDPAKPIPVPGDPERAAPAEGEPARPPPGAPTPEGPLYAGAAMSA